MNDDEFHLLLEQADLATSPPTVQSGLTARVLQRVHRRAIRQRVILGLLAAVSIGLVVTITTRKAHSPIVAAGLTVRQIAEIRAELLRLDADAVEHQRNADALAKRDAASFDPRYLNSLNPENDPITRVRQAEDRTAALLLQWGDRAVEKQQNREQAEEIYSEAANLFPDTPAGKIAADRAKMPKSSI